MNELITSLMLALASVSSPVDEENLNYTEMESKIPEENAEVPEENSEEGGDTYQVFLDPLYRTRLYAEINVPIIKIYKRMGDSFDQDDVLLVFDNRVFEGAHLKAEAALVKAQTELEGKSKLYQDDITSLFELKEAEANVATAKADLLAAKKNLDASIIKAPYKGKVVTLYIEEHELPQQGKELIEIVDDEKLIAKLLLPSRLLPKLKKGQKLTIHIKETGEDATAEITRISPVIDPTSSTIKIEAEIDNSEGNLHAGMIGTIRIR